MERGKPKLSTLHCRAEARIWHHQSQRMGYKALSEEEKAHLTPSERAISRAAFLTLRPKTAAERRRSLTADYLGNTTQSTQKPPRRATRGKTRLPAADTPHRHRENHDGSGRTAHSPATALPCHTSRSSAARPRLRAILEDGAAVQPRRRRPPATARHHRRGADTRNGLRGRRKHHVRRS